MTKKTSLNVEKRRTTARAALAPPIERRRTANQRENHKQH